MKFKKFMNGKLGKLIDYQNRPPPVEENKDKINRDCKVRSLVLESNQDTQIN